MKIKKNGIGVVCWIDSGDMAQLPKKNDHHRTRAGISHRFLSSRALRFRRLMNEAAMEYKCTHSGRISLPIISNGRWQLDIVVFHHQRRHLDSKNDDGLFANIDSDACLEPVRDAIEHAGIIDNDARIVTDRTAAIHSKRGPAILWSLSPWDNDEPEGWPHYIRMVPGAGLVMPPGFI